MRSPTIAIRSLLLQIVKELVASNQWQGARLKGPGAAGRRLDPRGRLPANPFEGRVLDAQLAAQEPR